MAGGAVTGADAEARGGYYGREWEVGEVEGSGAVGGAPGGGGVAEAVGEAVLQLGD